MKREAEREADDSGGLTNGYASDSRLHPSNALPPNGAPPSESSSAPFSSADISRSLLYIIWNNIGQIAYLQSQKHFLVNIFWRQFHSRIQADDEHVVLRYQDLE
jgi:type II pantothenate kinase